MCLYLCIFLLPNIPYSLICDAVYTFEYGNTRGQSIGIMIYFLLGMRRFESVMTETAPRKAGIQLFSHANYTAWPSALSLYIFMGLPISSIARGICSRKDNLQLYLQSSILRPTAERVLLNSSCLRHSQRATFVKHLSSPL